ncbi:MAG: hypothetical protein ABJR46_15045 [Tateyamaria sp.]|uniref:hypothetical protein n=1 Tax=Tateyamaria sp. TaxID=1929288 RepID=UPI00329C5D59
MNDIKTDLFNLIFENPSTEGIIALIEDGSLRSTDNVPNVFDGFTLNQVFGYLVHSDVIAAEYKEKFSAMARVADEACMIEEDLDHGTRDAVSKRLKQLKL